MHNRALQWCTGAEYSFDEHEWYSATYVEQHCSVLSLLLLLLLVNYLENSAGIPLQRVKKEVSQRPSISKKISSRRHCEEETSVKGTVGNNSATTFLRDTQTPTRRRLDIHIVIIKICYPYRGCTIFQNRRCRDVSEDRIVLCRHISTTASVTCDHIVKKFHRHLCWNAVAHLSSKRLIFSDARFLFWLWW